MINKIKKYILPLRASKNYSDKTILRRKNDNIGWTGHNLSTQTVTSAGKSGHKPKKVKNHCYRPCVLQTLNKCGLDSVPQLLKYPWANLWAPKTCWPTAFSSNSVKRYCYINKWYKLSQQNHNLSTVYHLTVKYSDVIGDKNDMQFDWVTIKSALSLPQKYFKSQNGLYRNIKVHNTSRGKK